LKKEITYKESGVDIDRAVEAKNRIKRIVERFNIKTEGGIGGFGAIFPFKESLIVSSVDGVGTKLKVAFLAGIHNTVGRDLVNHCVNDILVQGAKPLFFMDYIALYRMDPDLVEKIVEGIAEGCRENGCKLAGGRCLDFTGKGSMTLLVSLLDLLRGRIFFQKII